jgi:anaerobic glycerol-3-phosphate dehydrogenase
MTPAQIPSLLSGLADELALMIPMVEALADLVKDHAVKADAIDRPRILNQGQSVDDLSQRLAALRTLAEALSDGARIETALDTMPLADLAARLSLAIGTLPTLSPALVAHGDLMLFDQP